MTIATSAIMVNALSAAQQMSSPSDSSLAISMARARWLLVMSTAMACRMSLSQRGMHRVSFVSLRKTRFDESEGRRVAMHIHHHLYHFIYPFIPGAILLEILYFGVIQHRSYPFLEMFASIVIWILRMPVRLLRPLIVAPIGYFLWTHRVSTIPLDGPWGLLLLFLGTELTYYWMHRASHEVRWLWASHVVHHTPEHIHLASAFRLGATELFSGGWLFHLPLYWLGFNPLAVSGMLSVNLFYQFWLHTDLIGRLGPLEWIFNTPSHHRVHHASNPEYVDRNYGGILIVWDRLFGTFAQEESHTPITYGLVHPIGSSNPLKILFHEWIAMGRDFVRARTARERVRQLFGRPADSLAGAMARSPRQVMALGAD